MSETNGRITDYVIRARNNAKFKAEHFILSQVTAELLKQNGIAMTVEKFKKIVRGADEAFKASAGNTKKAPLNDVKVYSIIEIKKLIEKGGFIQ